METTVQPTEFERKKTSYFSRFALGHLRDMRILRKGGVLGKENRDWRNISEHAIVEAVGADILAEALNTNREDVIQAANLHDWYKRREVEMMKKLGGAQGHAVTAVEDKRLLHEYGVPPHIVKLAHSNIPDSIDREYLSSRTLEEKIMHYMDLITSGSDFMNFRDRINIVAQEKHNVEFSDSFRDKYGGKSLFEVQEEVAQLEESEFEKLLGVPSGGVIQFIRKKLEERINAQE